MGTGWGGDEPTSLIDKMGRDLHGDDWPKMKAKLERDSRSEGRQKHLGYAIAFVVMFIGFALVLLGMAVAFYELLSIPGWVG